MIFTLRTCGSSSSWLVSFVLIPACVMFPSEGFPWPTIELEAALDNTLYETEIDDPPVKNELSNGEGIFLFSGRTGLDGGFRLRRALLKFDLSALPPGSEILAAEVVIYHSRAAPGSPPSQMTLHRILREWGEGSSDAAGPEGQGALAQPGDATWFQAIYNSGSWRAPGSDFVDQPSASTSVGSEVGSFVWSCTPDMLDDLNDWLREPAANFGWVLRGFEDGAMNAHRFHSRHHLDVETRPRLHVVYRPPGTVLAVGFESEIRCQ